MNTARICAAVFAAAILGGYIWIAVAGQLFFRRVTKNYWNTVKKCEELISAHEKRLKMMEDTE